MKKRLCKALSVLLCVALLVSCLGMTAVATEADDRLAGRVPYMEENGPHYTEKTEIVERNVTRVYEKNGELRSEETMETEEVTHRLPAKKEKTLRSIGQMDEMTYTFTTFEDLKLLVSAEYEHYVELVYQGTGPLVISEDLTMPAFVGLYFDYEDSQLIINEGVTFEMSNYDGGLHVSKLDVRGKLLVKNYLYVEKLLSVSGELIMYTDITLNYGAQIIGAENIKQKYDHCHITWQARVTTLEEVIAFANVAATSADDYSVQVDVQQDVKLQQNLVIPANMRLYMWGWNEWGQATFTIAPGVTLEVNGNCDMEMPVIVEGTLNLNTQMYVYSHYEADCGITFTSAGRFTGKGYLYLSHYIENGNAGAYTDYVKGLDPAKIYVEEEIQTYVDELGETYSYTDWKIYPAEGKTKLSTPTDLQWNKEADWKWDSEKEEYTYYPVDRPASSLWKSGEITQNHYDVVFYRLREDGTSERLGEHGFWGSATSTYEYVSVMGLNDFDPETGDYYFTVQSMGDGVNYINSEVAKSDVWHYVRPDVTAGSCYDLQWNWPGGNWMSSPNKEEPRYDVEVLYTPVSFMEPHVRYGTSSREKEFEMWDDEYDVGYYYFRVRIISDDITQMANGAWSALSPAFKLTHTSDEVSVDLDSILGNTETMTEDEIRQSVQELDTEELRKSMEADHGASGVIEAMKELEAAVGGPAAVAVNTDAAEFDASKVSVVGANLNNVAKEDESVTLVIDKPQKEHVMDTMYDNSVSVTFSMTLDNVEDTKNLAVPVMITLPIPASINPNFLVVLHYAQDGSVHERILPHIFREGAQWYASFTLTSFSDFTLAQVNVNRPTVDMFRMYDPNSGEHFYTGSTEERDNLVAVGWNYEGVGFTFPLTTGDPVYRLFDPVTGEHLYTMDEVEKATLMAQGWNYEGIAFNSAYDVEVPQYRLHNPNATRGAYHFTASQKEADYLMSLGWEYQGIGWYSCGVIPE